MVVFKSYLSPTPELRHQVRDQLSRLDDKDGILFMTMHPDDKLWKDFLSDRVHVFVLREATRSIRLRDLLARILLDRSSYVPTSKPN
jgi:hypothetical protein